MKQLTEKDKLDELLALVKGKQSDYWMDINETVRYTKLSKSSLRRATQKGVLRVSKRTGKNLFKKSWVDRWLNG